MQEKSEQNFPFNTEVQENLVENGSWVAVKRLIALAFRVDSEKAGDGDILQSDISHLQLNTLLWEWIVEFRAQIAEVRYSGSALSRNLPIDLLGISLSDRITGVRIVGLLLHMTEGPIY